MIYKYDFLVIGAGVAGMSYALKVARAKKGNSFVIIGRCADALLKDYNPLNIFVYAENIL